MIAAEIQQRDEALTAAGHDPECAAFDDRECSCGIGTAQPDTMMDWATLRAQGKRKVPSSTPGITLTGAAASAFAEYQAAMRELRDITATFERARDRAQRAQQALAEAAANL